MHAMVFEINWIVFHLMHLFHAHIHIITSIYQYFIVIEMTDKTLVVITSLRVCFFFSFLQSFLVEFKL